MSNVDFFRKFISDSLMNLKDKNSNDILLIYEFLHLCSKKEGFNDYCIEKYGEYKSICIKQILGLISIDYLLINDNFKNTQGINNDKINNLKELLEVLVLLAS